MFQNKEQFKATLIDYMEKSYGKSLDESTMIEKYLVLADMVNSTAKESWKGSKEATRNKNKKQMYYFSLEFLMGRMLSNNLMNLGVYTVVKDGLNDLGIDIIVALIFKDAVDAAAGIEDGLLPGPDDQVASLFDLPVLPFVKE